MQEIGASKVGVGLGPNARFDFPGSPSRTRGAFHCGEERKLTQRGKLCENADALFNGPCGAWSFGSKRVTSLARDRRCPLFGSRLTFPSPRCSSRQELTVAIVSRRPWPLVMRVAFP